MGKGKEVKLILTQEQIAILNKCDKRIRENIGKIEKGYLTIAPDVGLIAKHKLYVDGDYANIYDMCQDMYGMARGTVSHLKTIADRFGDKDTCKILPLYHKFSLTQLLAMAKEDAGAVDILIEDGRITEQMTVKEINALLRGVLADEIEEQPNGADGEETTAIEEEKKQVAESEKDHSQEEDETKQEQEGVSYKLYRTLDFDRIEDAQEILVDVGRALKEGSVRVEIYVR